MGMSNIADINEAIRATLNDLASTLHGYPERVALLDNLAALLEDQLRIMNDHRLAERPGIMYHLEEVIRLAQEAVETTPENHPDRAKRLNNLGRLFDMRFQRTNEISDLKKAIKAQREAIEITPRSYPERSGWAFDLADMLTKQRARTNLTCDLEDIIQAMREAVICSPEGAVSGRRLLFLGIQLEQLYEETGDVAHLREAISHYQSILRLHDSSVSCRLTASRKIMDACQITLDWQTAYEASDIAVSLIRQLALALVVCSEGPQNLEDVMDLASEAAACALNVGKGAFEALALLERGRGLVAAYCNEVRGDILHLQRRYPELAGKLTRFKDELQLPVQHDGVWYSADPSWNGQVRGTREGAQGLDDLVAEIRNQPGFENFLGPMSEKQMCIAAERGPIIVINTTYHRCDAILIQPHQIRTLALPKLHSRDIMERARNGGLWRLENLEWLWDTVTDPILDALGFIELPSDGNWPHVCWIPTGKLRNFPLHVAGYHYKGSTKSVLDRVISSYSSSVRAIVGGRERGTSSITSTGPDQEILIARSDTPGYLKLPFADAEVSMLHHLCPSMGLEIAKIGRRKEDVLEGLKTCGIFHFVGHGEIIINNPKDSGLHLEDGMITVDELIRMDRRKQPPFLAYLSGCGSGQMEDYPLMDESVHIIGACKSFGFRHVIGTLWEVNDQSCVDMAKVTYETMRNNGFTDEWVSWGLHRATRELRASWLDEPKSNHEGLGVEKTQALSRTENEQDHGESPGNSIHYEEGNGKMLSTWTSFVHYGG